MSRDSDGATRGWLSVAAGPAVRGPSYVILLAVLPGRAAPSLEGVGRGWGLRFGLLSVLRPGLRSVLRSGLEGRRTSQRVCQGSLLLTTAPDFGLFPSWGRFGRYQCGVVPIGRGSFQWSVLAGMRWYSPKAFGVSAMSPSVGTATAGEELGANALKHPSEGLVARALAHRASHSRLTFSTEHSRETAWCAAIDRSAGTSWHPTCLPREIRRRLLQDQASPPRGDAPHAAASRSRRAPRASSRHADGARPRPRGPNDGTSPGPSSSRRATAAIDSSLSRYMRTASSRNSGDHFDGRPIPADLPPAAQASIRTSTKESAASVSCIARLASRRTGRAAVEVWLGVNDDGCSERNLPHEIGEVAACRSDAAGRGCAASLPRVGSVNGDAVASAPPGREVRLAG